MPNDSGFDPNAKWRDDGQLAKYGADNWVIGTRMTRYGDEYVAAKLATSTVTYSEGQVLAVVAGTGTVTNDADTSRTVPAGILMGAPSPDDGDIVWLLTRGVKDVQKVGGGGGQAFNTVGAAVKLNTASDGRVIDFAPNTDDPSTVVGVVEATATAAATTVTVRVNCQYG